MGIWHYLITNQPAWISNVSNLTSITIFGAIAGFYNRFECNKPGCYRIGRHPVKGTTYRSCNKHMTAEDHAALRRLHAKKRPKQHAFLNPTASS